MDSRLATDLGFTRRTAKRRPGRRSPTCTAAPRN